MSTFVIPIQMYCFMMNDIHSDNSRKEYNWPMLNYDINKDVSNQTINFLVNSILTNIQNVIRLAFRHLDWTFSSFYLAPSEANTNVKTSVILVFKSLSKPFRQEPSPIQDIVASYQNIYWQAPSMKWLCIAGLDVINGIMTWFRHGR